MCSDLAKLRANLENLNASDKTAALSMLSQSRTRTLSDKQMNWARALASKNNPSAANNQAVRAASLTPKAELFNGIRALFDRNIAKGSKSLAIRVCADGDNPTNLKVSIASDMTRLHVAELDSGEAESRYFGFIDASGEFHKSARVERDEGVMAALTKLDADPMAAALDYGRKTGSCCVCGRELTNGVSIAEGIGPICSGRLQ